MVPSRSPPFVTVPTATSGGVPGGTVMVKSAFTSLQLLCPHEDSAVKNTLKAKSPAARTAAVIGIRYIVCFSCLLGLRDLEAPWRFLEPTVPNVTSAAWKVVI